MATFSSEYVAECKIEDASVFGMMLALSCSNLVTNNKIFGVNGVMIIYIYICNKCGRSNRGMQQMWQE